MTILNLNFILQADSYKVNHYLQIPEGVKWVQSSIVARKPSPRVKTLVAAGTQYLVKYLESIRITMADIDEAEIETREQGYDFNKEGWVRIVEEMDGKLPLRIFSIPEGTVFNPGIAMVLMENTVEWAAWLPSYVETIAQCIIWKFTTVASISRNIYKTLKYSAEKTGSPAAGVAYGLHNFGDRGADSPESAAFAGMAHAMIFSGSDSLKTNSNIKKLFNTKTAYMSSVEASEHSTMTMNADATTRNDYNAAVMMVERLEAVVRRVKEQGTGVPIVSVVIDTYDSHRFVREFLATLALKYRIINSGGKLVLRPDSGNPLIEPITILNLAGEVFGYTINEFGYKELPPYIGVLQGDGINETSLVQILDKVVEAGWATGNILFGMGGGLTHEAGRDEFSFSQKATAMSYATDPMKVSSWISLKKEPVTDLNKTSLSGYIINVIQDGVLVSLDRRTTNLNRVDIMVFENGVSFVSNVTFDAVKERASV